MKKLIVVALATLFLAGIIAETAVADDRLQLSGYMRVRAWDKDGADKNANKQDYFDQRFRIQSTIMPADGVKAVLRANFTNETWQLEEDKEDGASWSDARNDTDVDRAYLKVDKGMFGVTAGLNIYTLGNAIAYDNPGTGIQLDIKTPVVISLGYTKEDERGSKEDYYDENTNDQDTVFVNLGYAADTFSVNGFFARQIDGNKDSYRTDDSYYYEPYVYGLQGTFETGILKFNGELNIFGGRANSVAGSNDDVDIMGTQFWGNVEAAVMENLTIGLDLVYSDGTDGKDNEIKIAELNDDADWSIADRGTVAWNVVLPLGDSDVMAPMPWRISDEDWSGQQGAIGAGVYGRFTPVEGVDLYAQIMYLAPEEDEYQIDGEMVKIWDDVMVYNLAAEWFFAPNTSITAQWTRADWNSDYSEIDDAYDVFGARLMVTF